MPLVVVCPYRKKTQLAFSSGIDPFFENVVSLCHFDVTGAPIDQISGNSWTLSTATVDNTRPKFGAMSLAIPNSKAYASNTNSQMVVGTADFTLEFFFYTQNTAGNYYNLYNDSSSNIFDVYGDSPSGLSLWFSGAHHYPGFSVTPNTWHHLAVVRQNGILYTFVDGVLGASTFSYTGEVTNNGAFAIGSQLSGTAYPTNGNIDEFRFTKGIARYTTNNFPVASQAFTDGRDDAVDPYMGMIPYLANYDSSVTQVNAGTCTVAVTGSPSISSVASKFGGNSLFFPTTGGNYLTLSPYANFNFNGDFTVECWINPSARTDGDGYQTIFSHDNGGIASTIQCVALYWTRSTGKLLLGVGHSNANITGTAVLNANTWHHVAVTRQGSTYRIFVDGILDGTSTYATNFSDSGFGTYIGKINYSDRGANFEYFGGYIDDFRITNVCRYTKSFAVPTSAFASTFESGYDPYALRTVYNLPFDANVNSTVKGYNGTQSGGQLSAGKFGNCFEKVNGTDYISYPPGAHNHLTNKEFTIDGWFYNPGSSAYGSYIISCWRESGSTKAWAVNFDSTNKLYFYYTTNGSSNISIVTSTAPSLNVWHHFAVVRHITLGFAIFVDGVLVAPFTASSNTIYSSTEPVVVGGTANNSYSAGLKLDDIRLTVGACRYTTPFIPPTSANKTA